MIKRIKNIFGRQSEFTKNVLILVSGTAIAQLLPILASFILTRLYTPEDFGVFTLIISLIAFGSVFITGRYEVAIILPKEEKEAQDLAVISSSLGLGSSLIFFLFIFFFREQFASWIGLRVEFSFWLYWVPLLIFLTAQQKILDFVVNRQQKFGTLAKNRIGRSVTLTGTQLSLGFAKFSGGLIVGNFLATIYSVLFLLYRQSWKLKDLSFKNLGPTAKKYIKFPKFSLAADTINSFSNHIPVILITLYFTEEMAGYYGFTLRILSLPLALVASSILDVFKQKASNEFNELGNCKRIYLKTLKKLLLISVIPFLILAFIAPDAFAMFFGEGWKEAGVYAQILCIMFFMRFVVSPLSYVLYIANKQNYDLLWQISLAVFTLTSFYVGHIYDDIHIALWCFSASYGFLYFVYLLMSYRFSLGAKTKLT